MLFALLNYIVVEPRQDANEKVEISDFFLYTLVAARISADWAPPGLAYNHIDVSDRSRLRQFESACQPGLNFASRYPCWFASFFVYRETGECIPDQSCVNGIHLESAVTKLAN